MYQFFNEIVNAFKTLGANFGLNNIFICSFAVLFLAIIIQTIVAECSLEARTARAIVKIETYLENNPFITNENIVEFNRLMKKIPKTLRTRWQQYVVNRTKKPSDFLNEEDCIEKPFKTKGFTQAISVFKNILVVLASFSFIFSACAIESNNIVTAIVQSTFTAASLVGIGFIYLTCLKLRHSQIRTRMYLNFDAMTRLLDRAVTTFPDFVDYEILFTKKEIDAMIPELQEYLRQRALKEQEQLENAKAQQVEHENYDFSEIGTDGALVMERAVKECEFYLGNRRKTLVAIEQLQTEKDLLTKNYDEKNKVSQRKLRDINETLDRLKEKLNNTTNKIVGNDIRRQQAEEVKKQQNIEREIEEDNNRYNEELKKVDAQIKARHEEIDKSKSYVETAFNNEFKAYADKVYNELYSIANEKVKENVESVNAENQSLKQELEERDTYIKEKNNLFDEKVEEVKNATALAENLQNSVKQYEDYKNQAEEYMDQKDKELESKNQEIFALTSANENLKKNLEIQERKYKELRKQRVKEITRYFDVNGNEFFYDQNGLPYFYDQNGLKVYYYNNGAEQDQIVEEDANVLPQKKVELQPTEKPEEANDLKGVEIVDLDKEENIEPKQQEVENEDKENQEQEEIKPEEPLQENKEPEDEDEAEFKRLLDEYLKEDKEGTVADDYPEDDEEDESVEETSKSPSINDWIKQQEDNAYFEQQEEKQEEKVEETNPAEETTPVEEKNPDEKLKDIKKAIDEEIKKLEEEHEKLASNMDNVAKELEIKTEPETTEPQKEETKEKPEKKSSAKKPASKKSTAKKTATKKPATKKKTEVAKKDASVKDASLENKEDDKKASQTKPKTKKGSVAAKKSSTTKAKKTSTAKTTKAKADDKKAKVKEEPKAQEKVDIGLEDFSKELNQALTDVNKQSKKSKK